METTDTRALTWRKSSYSTGNPACVEIAHTPATISIRDSKDPNGPTLLVSPAAFRGFLKNLP